MTADELEELLHTARSASGDLITLTLHRERSPACDTIALCKDVHHGPVGLVLDWYRYDSGHVRVRARFQRRPLITWLVRHQDYARRGGRYAKASH